MNRILISILAFLPFIATAGWASAASMNEMDHGPFVSWTIRGEGNPVTYKGIVVRVGADPKAAICFDTDLLRVSAAWTGGFLQWYPERDGLERNPTIQGVVHHQNDAGPGWSLTGNFSDRRALPYGPLPSSEAHYDGLFTHGDKVVLAYTVGQCRVLELPGFQTIAGEPFFTRSFNLNSAPHPMTLRVCQIAGKDPGFSYKKGQSTNSVLWLSSEATHRVLGFTRLPDGAAWQIRDHHLCLELPARTAPARFQLFVGSEPRSVIGTMLNEVSAVVARSSVPALEEFCHGSRPRWSSVLETRTSFGTSKDALVADVLTVPEQNQWHSWIRFGGIDFLSADQAILGSVSGDVWLVSGLSDPGGKLAWKRFATGLYQPLDVKIVDGRIYVIGRDQITRLHDLNGDGEADYYENFNNGWMVAENFHSFVLNLETDSHGDFFFAQGAPWPPEVKTPHQGVLFKLSKDGKRLDNYADGLRGPNGMAIGPDDLIVYTDNEGHWLPTCSLQWVRKGGFHGMKPTAHRSPEPIDFEKPLCWIPHQIDNSAGDPVWVPHGQWGPLQDKLLLTSYGKASLSLVMTENIGSVRQGGVVAFPLRFQSGLIRARFNPYDQNLYVCGLSVWQTAGVRPGGFYRVRYTGNPLHLPIDLKVQRNGIQLAFAEPLDSKTALDLGSFRVEQWNYRWVETYGSPHYSVKDPDKTGHDDVPIHAVALSSDGRSVTMRTDPLQPVMQMHISYDLQAADGTRLRQDIYNTINALPPPAELPNDGK